MRPAARLLGVADDWVLIAYHHSSSADPSHRRTAGTAPAAHHRLTALISATSDVRILIQFVLDLVPHDWEAMRTHAHSLGHSKKLLGG